MKDSKKSMMMRSKHAHFENQVEMPSVPADGHMEKGMGVREFKGQADPIAYGQASKEGCGSDEKKIMSQMKNYNWH